MCPPLFRASSHQYLYICSCNMTAPSGETRCQVTVSQLWSLSKLQDKIFNRKPSLILRLSPSFWSLPGDGKLGGGLGQSCRTYLWLCVGSLGYVSLQMELCFPSIGSMFWLTCDCVLGMKMTHLYSRELQRCARPIPVLPAVPSTIIPPGLTKPAQMYRWCVHIQNISYS